MRSRGAVKDFAAAPARAPARKRAASLGTNATTARGCCRSCAAVGANSLSNFLSATETLANLQRVPLVGAKKPVTASFLRGLVGGTRTTSVGEDLRRMGILRHVSVARSSDSDMLGIFVLGRWKFRNERRYEDNLVGVAERG